MISVSRAGVRPLAALAVLRALDEVARNGKPRPLRAFEFRVHLSAKAEVQEPRNQTDGLCISARITTQATDLPYEASLILRSGYIRDTDRS